MKEFIDTFKARSCGAKSLDVSRDLIHTEARLLFQIPDLLRDLLIHFRTAVIFDEQVKFKPNSRSGVEDADGYLSLEILYGPSADTNSIRGRVSTYEGLMPPGIVPIGEAPGGDQICLETRTGRILLWLHEARSEPEVCSEIAESFEQFVAKLQVLRKSEPSPRKEIVEGESFLDF
jgi:hypothetical protein